MGKSLSNNYGQKLLDSAKKIYNRCHKNSIEKSNSKNSRSIDLIGNKIADKIASVSKKPFNNNNNNNNEDVEITDNKKKYISPEERQQIINELRLVPKKDANF